MANTLIPAEERNLTPDQVELLDRRRRRGQLFLTIAWQCVIISLLLLIWSGQDATYSPGFARPVLSWLAPSASPATASAAAPRSSSATKAYRYIALAKPKPATLSS